MPAVLFFYLWILSTCECRESEAIRAVNLWTCYGDFLNPVDPQMAERLIETCGERSVYVRVLLLLRPFHVTYRREEQQS